MLVVKNPAANTGDSSSIPGSGRPLEKEMATHSSILAWEISWTESLVVSKSWTPLSRDPHNLPQSWFQLQRRPSFLTHTPPCHWKRPPCCQRVNLVLSGTPGHVCVHMWMCPTNKHRTSKTWGLELLHQSLTEHSFFTQRSELKCTQTGPQTTASTLIQVVFFSSFKFWGEGMIFLLQLVNWNFVRILSVDLL